MKKYLQWLKEEESGQGMVEYGLIIAAVALVALVGFNLLGGSLDTFISSLGSDLKKPTP